MTDTYPLAPHELRAVHHVLENSALASCAGTGPRVYLVDGPYLVLEDVESWPWSSGERVLLDFLRWVVGAGRVPDVINGIDEHEQLIVREALRLLTREPVS